MSGGLLSNYIQLVDSSYIDLSGFFPAYEIITKEINPTSRWNSYTFTLTRNINNSIDYIVIYSIEYAQTTTDQASRNAKPLVIYEKGSASFKLYFLLKATPSESWSGSKLNCLVVYPYNPTSPIITNTSYTVSSDVSGNMVNNLPQYITFIDEFNSKVANVEFLNSLTTKKTSRTDYVSFGTYEYIGTSPTVDLVPGELNSVIFLNTSTRTASSYYVGFQKGTNYTLHGYINVLTLYPSIGPFSSQYPNYKSNYYRNINDISIDLTSIFPKSEVFSQNISETDTSPTLTFKLLRNTTNTTNYYVFASYYYNTQNGSGDTYSWSAASGSAYQLLIINKTSINFQATFDRSSGERWNGGIYCIVIYP